MRGGEGRGRETRGGEEKPEPNICLEAPEFVATPLFTCMGPFTFTGPFTCMGPFTFTGSFTCMDQFTFTDPFTFMGPFIFTGPFTCMRPFRFCVALLDLYWAFYHHTGLFTSHIFVRPIQSRGLGLVCAGSVGPHANRRQRIETPEPLLKQEATSLRGEEWNGSLVLQLTDCGCTYGSWQTRPLSTVAYY